MNLAWVLEWMVPATETSMPPHTRKSFAEKSSCNVMLFCEVLQYLCHFHEMPSLDLCAYYAP